MFNVMREIFRCYGILQQIMDFVVFYSKNFSSIQHKLVLKTFIEIHLISHSITFTHPTLFILIIIFTKLYNKDYEFLMSQQKYVLPDETTYIDLLMLLCIT